MFKKIILVVLILFLPSLLVPSLIFAKKIRNENKERPYNNWFFGLYYAPFSHIDFSGVRFPMPINHFDKKFVPDHFGRGSTGNDMYTGTANVEIPLMGLNFSYYFDNGKNKVWLISSTIAFQQLNTAFTASPHYTVRGTNGKLVTLKTTAKIKAVFNSWKLDLDGNWRFASIDDLNKANFYLGAGFAIVMNIEDADETFLLETIDNKDIDYRFKNGSKQIKITPGDIGVEDDKQFTDLVETELLVYSFKVNVMGEYFHTLWGQELGIRAIVTANINLGKSHFKFEQTQSSVFTVNGAFQLNIPFTLFGNMFTSKGAN